MNHTRDSLSGQPTAIVAIPPRSAILTAIPLVVLIAAPAAPVGTFILPSPPPARYLHSSTTRDRLNHTLNGLAIGPESVQPMTITTTPPRTQTSTPTTPRLLIASIPQQAVLTASTLPPATALPIPPATLIAAPLATPIAAFAAPSVPSAPATPPGP